MRPSSSHNDEAASPSPVEKTAHSETYDLSREQSFTSVDQTFKNRDDHLFTARPDTKTNQLLTIFRAWQTPTSIIGFYVIACLTATAHFSIFNYLHGRIATRINQDLPFKTTSIPQSYVTTTSLLLVTIFRASLVASVGACYAQCLWRTLRRQTMEVQLIEELFQIRANALRLLNPVLLWCSPSLVALAAMSWLVPLATIYPPGALTIGLESVASSSEFNVSVIPWGGGEEYRNRNFSDIPGAEPVPLRAGPYTSFARGLRCYSNDSSEGCGSYTRPIQPLVELAKKVIVRAEIPALRDPSQGNGSYTLTFTGPVMRCRDSNGTNETRTFPSDYTSFGNNSFLTADFAQRYHTWRMWNETDSIVVEEAPSRYTGLQVLFKPCPRLLAGRTPVDYDVAVNTTLYRPVERRRCETVPATYDVRVSFLNGVQTVEYNTSDIRPLVEQDTDPEEVPHWQERYNVLALGHAMALNFVGNGVGVSRPWLSFDGDVPKPTTLVLDNGTQVEEACWGTWGNGLAVIPGEWQSNSVFELSPFTGPVTSDDDNPIIYIRPLSESLLNEVLANITIGALTLDLWRGMVSGSVSRTYTVFRFDRRINFYLPYGLCLLFSLPVVALGMLALRRNGVSAIDGGFVQILMTAATGETAVEKAARRGCMGGAENMPEELMRLKVRFGELVAAGVVDVGERKTESEAVVGLTRKLDEDELVSEDAAVSLLGSHDGSESRGAGIYQSKGVVYRRAGFGTREETIPLLEERGLI